MTNTYTWDCKTVDTYPTHTDDNSVTQSDVVYNVHWKVTGDDGTNNATNIGTQTLEVSDISSFTSFDSIAHSDVVGWVQAALGTERVSELESSLDAKLVEMATPTSVTRIIEE
tara:strand:+ start:645 stop:983 length:339 start_codon:yes stop_codon:yes gene_type:complete